MKTILTLLVALVGVLQYELWFSEGGLLSAMKLQHSITKQQQIQQQLQQRNQALLADIKDLKNSPEAIVSHARYDLGMIKRGETFYQLVQSQSPS